MRLAVYISSHGFGHLAQTVPVLEELKRQHPELRVVLRTALPESCLRRRISFPFEMAPGQVDVGFVQRDALHEDIETTILEVRKFHANWGDRIRCEKQWLKKIHPDFVLSNISYLGLLAAAHIGVPSFALGSLDWHAAYCSIFKSDSSILQQIADAYASCELLLELPLGMPMKVFPSRIQIGHIAMASIHERDEIRARLGLMCAQKKIALVLFGGTCAPEFDIHAIQELDEWLVLLPTRQRHTGSLPFNVRFVPDDFEVVDLIMASDVIVTKPGYGIITEAWAAGKPIAYVPRNEFPEYPYLKRWLDAHAPARELGRESFRSGMWGGVLEELYNCDRSYPKTSFDGEKKAVEIITGMLQN